jgi:hypothetical protein
MKNIFGAHKQWLCIVVFAMLCTGAFSQTAPEQSAEAGAAAGPAKNAVMLDLMPLFKGILMSDGDHDLIFVPFSLAYERQIAPHFSIGPELDLYFGKYGKPYMYFSMAMFGRYYPMSPNMEKFFLGAVLGFNVQSIDGKTGNEYGGFAGPLLGLRAGYRLLLGKIFFVEPSMAYVYSKSADWALGWQGGLRLGVQF